MHSLKQSNSYELLLAGVIALRATSFIFSKMLLAELDSFNLLSLRFLFAFALLLLIFRRRLKDLNKKTMLAGMVIGTLFFLTMSFEMAALKQADSSLVSLLENCSIIIVPILEAILLHRMMGKAEIGSALIAMAGVLCLAASQGKLSGGMTLGLAAALCYAVAILVTAKFSHEASDPLHIGIVQVGTMGILALTAALIKGGYHFPQTSTQWIYLAVLTIVCTGFGFTLQPVAQSRVSAERAGLFCAISPAVANLLGVLVLHERVTPLSILGLLLILFSIVFPYLKKQSSPA